MVKKNFKLTGFVLQKKILLKNDCLVKIFTKEKGKISVLAKGVRKITSRRLSHLQTGNLIKMIIYKKNAFFYLKETDLISGFISIKNDKVKEKDFYYLFYLIERLLPEEQKNKSLYNLLTKNIYLLKNSDYKILTDFKKNFTKMVLIDLGYIDKNYPSNNDLYQKVEEIINEKIPSYII